MRQKLLVVGAFPEPSSLVVGGIVTACQILLKSDFSKYFDLILIDSTQLSNPPPGLAVRALKAMLRTYKYLVTLILNRPVAVLLFTATGMSVVEKGFMAWLARFLKIPALLFPRGAELIELVQNSRLQKLWVLPAMRGATHLLCQGPAWQRFAVMNLGFKEDKTVIVHNWTATPDLLEIGRQRELLDNPEKINILFLGWLEEEKGIFDLLEVCRLISFKYSFKLTIAGRGSAEQNARKYVRLHNLENHVHFSGWVYEKQKNYLLETADMLVLPSRAEGFPNAIIEAMAAKVAVIVTAVGNIPDLLKNREQALIVPPKDTDMLKCAIEELIVNPDLRSQLAYRGHIYAQKYFSTEGCIRHLISVIDNLVSKSRFGA